MLCCIKTFRQLKCFVLFIALRNYIVMICNYLQLLMFDHGRACFYAHLISLRSSCAVRNQLLRCSIAFYSMFFHDLVFFILMGLFTSRVSASGFAFLRYHNQFLPSS
jgi:hypothetical protein